MAIELDRFQYAQDSDLMEICSPIRAGFLSSPVPKIPAPPPILRRSQILSVRSREAVEHRWV